MHEAICGFIKIVPDHDRFDLAGVATSEPWKFEGWWGVLTKAMSPANWKRKLPRKDVGIPKGLQELCVEAEEWRSSARCCPKVDVSQRRLSQILKLLEERSQFNSQILCGRHDPIVLTALAGVKSAN